MQHRQIGDSNLKLSAITFDAWTAVGRKLSGTDKTDIVRAIHASYEYGVTSIDTAPVYGQGMSEQNVGAAVRSIPRDKVQILTKYGMRGNLATGYFARRSKDAQGKNIDFCKYVCEESIIKACEDSLRRLRTDYIDLYQIRWPESPSLISESMAAVEKLIEQGKVRYAGVCNYSVEQMMEAGKYINVVSNQVPYSMVKREIETAILPHCFIHKKGVLAYSPLEGGSITGNLNVGPKWQESDRTTSFCLYADERIERANEFLRKIEALAKEKKVTLAQLALQWTIQQRGISVVLAGARNAEQAKHNALAVDAPLTSKETDWINTQLSSFRIDISGDCNKAGASAS